MGNIWFGSVTTVDIYEVDVNQFFAAQKDFIDVTGALQLGTLVMPLGDFRTSVTKKGVTTIDSFLDTSWTNTAFVNVRPDGHLLRFRSPQPGR
jgi:hypothetical protein